MDRVPKMETWRETCKEPTFLSENKREFQFSTKFRKWEKTWLNRNGGINPKKKKKKKIRRHGGAALKWPGGQQGLF
jgi:hypothetical protein